MWERLDHLAILIGLGTPLGWVMKMAYQNLRRIEILWRELGYGSWDGNERRSGRERRVVSIEWDGVERRKTQRRNHP